MARQTIENRESATSVRTKLNDNFEELYEGELAIESFAQALTFDKDKELAFNSGGTLSFTLAGSGNVNGKGIILKLNTPTSVAFSADFIASSSSSSFDATKMNLVTLVFFDNWNGAGANKVVYNNTTLTAV